MSSSIRLGTRFGGRQAPRREPLFRARIGAAEVAALVVAAAHGVLAWYLVGELGLASGEAVARTARLSTLWDGFSTSLVAFGFERPPLSSALALPFAALDDLRAHGLAAALGTSVAAGVAALAAAGVARRSGLTGPATILFVVAFAFHPLLVYAGVFGLPEALYASLILVALGQFASWLQHESVSSVIGAGVALGVAFLLRYNVVVVAVVMGAAFWWVAHLEEERRDEPDHAMATAMAFFVPIVFVSGLWTLLSWFPRGELFEYLRLAHEVTLLGADDLDVLRRLDDFRGDPLAVARWVGGWTALAAPASVLAIVALLAHAAYERSRGAVALAAVCAGLVLPEALALLLGSGQARVPHLFVMVVPAFAIVAFHQQRVTRGLRPLRYERRRRRVQLAWTGALAVASLASAAVIALMPASDRPAAGLEEALRSGVAPPAASADALAMAAFIQEHAAPGDVLVDIERHAEVMLLVDDPARFLTDADRGEEAALFEPFGVAGYVLVRRPLAGQGEGRIERAYEDLFATGASSLSLAFDSGEYRIYAVTGPALP